MNKTTLIIADGTKVIKDIIDIIEEVVIPSSVTDIEEHAFSGLNLTTITIPDSVKTIGYSAFRGCSHLKSVKISNGVKTIGYCAFGGCYSLEEITIPDSVTSIGDWAFDGCDSLTEITIPASVTSIGWRAFKDCKSLKAIYIDKKKNSLNPSYADIPKTTKVYWKGEWEKEEE